LYYRCGGKNRLDPHFEDMPMRRYYRFIRRGALLATLAFAAGNGSAGEPGCGRIYEPGCAVEPDCGTGPTTKIVFVPTPFCQKLHHRCWFLPVEPPRVPIVESIPTLRESAPLVSNPAFRLVTDRPPSAPESGTPPKPESGEPNCQATATNLQQLQKQVLETNANVAQLDQELKHLTLLLTKVVERLPAAESAPAAMPQK